jgi:putative oxidoreductase
MSTATGQIDSSRLIFPGLAGLYESVAPYSYSIIRFIAGAILVYHGYGKLFGGIIQGVADHVAAPLGLPMPLAWAYFLGGLEFFGGIALAAGFLTRPLAALVFGLMAVAVLQVHLPLGFFWTDGGFEYPLFWAVAALSFAIRGGGHYSLDALIGREI